MRIGHVTPATAMVLLALGLMVVGAVIYVVGLPLAKRTLRVATFGMRTFVVGAVLLVAIEVLLGTGKLLSMHW